jgi:Uma2 family endonuclease
MIAEGCAAGPRIRCPTATNSLDARAGRRYRRRMSHRAPGDRMTYAEYLAREATSDIKHEYIRGEVFVLDDASAMAGGTRRHAALTIAVLAEIRTALRGKRCEVYSSDLRVRVLATDLSTDMATYPDGSVVCGRAEMHPEDPNAITNPTVLVEVLSESTEAYDRGAKAAHYRRIPSLREYLLVSQEEPLIELFRRTDAGAWELLEVRAGMLLELRALGITLEVDAIYASPLA